MDIIIPHSSFLIPHSSFVFYLRHIHALAWLNCLRSYETPFSSSDPNVEQPIPNNLEQYTQEQRTEEGRWPSRFRGGSDNRRKIQVKSRDEIYMRNSEWNRYRKRSSFIHHSLLTCIIYTNSSVVVYAGRTTRWNNQCTYPHSSFSGRTNLANSTKSR